MPKEVIATDKAPRPVSPISQAAKAGGFLYTAGLLGRFPDGAYAEGMAGQARQVLENLRLIVEAAGGTLADVLRCEVHAVDLGEMPQFNEVWKEYFPTDPPARVGTQVAALVPGARVEVTAVAFVG